MSISGVAAQRPGRVARGLMAVVRGYRLMLSPWLGASCRFYPTCSVYSLGALERHGAAVGSYLTMHRLLRCHPLCAGGHDPVPAEPPRLFRHLVRGGGVSSSLSPTSHD